MKRQSTEQEKKIANHVSDKGLISKIYKEFLKTEQQKQTTPLRSGQRDLNRHFSKEDIQMVNRYMKTCSASLIIREMQIKTTMIQHLSPVRIAIIKQTRNNKRWQGCGDTGTPVHCWWECKLVQPPWKTVCRFLKKLKMELPYDPAILLLSIYLKKIKTLT